MIDSYNLFVLLMVKALISLLERLTVKTTGRLVHLGIIHIICALCILFVKFYHLPTCLDFLPMRTFRQSQCRLLAMFFVE